jgi:hypothetical protein
LQYILLLKQKQEGKQEHQGTPATSAGTLATEVMLAAVGTQATTALQATLPIKGPQMSSLIKNLT